MAIIRTTWDTTTNKDLLKEGTLRQVFDDTAREANVYYKPLVNEIKTSKWIEDDLQMGGLGLAVEIAEGQGIPIQKPVLGTKKTYTQRMFASGFRMTWAMDKANKYKLWENFAKKLRVAQDESKDIEIHVPFNSPTSTSLVCGTGFDSGVALASASHTGLGVGTAGDYDNLLSAALSVSALQSARYYFATLKDAMGMHVGAKATDLVFHPNLWFTVNELLGSANIPYEQSNTKNYLGSLGLKPYEDPRLTSTTMWYVLAKNADYDINVFTFYSPDFVVRDAPDTTRDRMITSLQAFTYGWGNARGVFCGNT